MMILLYEGVLRMKCLYIFVSSFVKYGNYCYIIVYYVNKKENVKGKL